jgi:hypothetical protein
MIDIVAWIVIAIGIAGAATTAIGLHVPGRDREHPSRDEYRAGWYWIGLSFLLVFSALAMLANNGHNKPLTWVAISAAGTIACTNATLWTIGRIRARH